MREREVFRGSRGSVSVDSRHLPVIFVRWRVAWELELVGPLSDWHARVLEKLEAEEQLAVLIIDVREVGPPSSEVRRAIVEGRERERERFARWVCLDIVVTDKPFMRGVLAAVQWVAPWVRMSSAQNLELALERGRSALAKRGVELLPLSAEDFER